MASVTKVMATTTAIAQFYQRGEVDLNWAVADDRLLGKDFAAQGKGPITLLHLLLHNSGFPADPVPNYYEQPFGCPESSKFHPDQTFTCQTQIWNAVLDLTLKNPIGEKYVYSDLRCIFSPFLRIFHFFRGAADGQWCGSMIVVMYIIGKLAKTYGYVSPRDLFPGCDTGGPGTMQCYYEAYVRKFVLEKLSMKDSRFVLPKEQWGRCAPAWKDGSYRHEVIQGYVYVVLLLCVVFWAHLMGPRTSSIRSDGNAYAMGGIAGHAGLFSTALDAVKLVRKWLYASPDDAFLNATTVLRFRTVVNLTQSSRALGWDTNDYKMSTSTPCGALSPHTYLHTGYTGTLLCLDPDRAVFTILLTNRVYPDPLNTKIQQFRRDFHALVQKLLDGGVRR